MKLTQFAAISAASMALAFSLPAWSEAPAEHQPNSSPETDKLAQSAKPVDTAEAAATKLEDDEGTIVLPGFYMEKPEDLDIRRPKQALRETELVTKTKFTRNAGR